MNMKSIRDPNQLTAEQARAKVNARVIKTYVRPNPMPRPTRMGASRKRSGISLVVDNTKEAA